MGTYNGEKYFTSYIDKATNETIGTGHLMTKADKNSSTFLNPLKNVAPFTNY